MTPISKFVTLEKFSSAGFARKPVGLSLRVPGAVAVHVRLSRRLARGGCEPWPSCGSEKGATAAATAWVVRRAVLGWFGWCCPSGLGWRGVCPWVPPVMSFWEPRYLTENGVPPSAGDEKSNEFEGARDWVGVMTQILQGRFGGDGGF